MTIQHLANTNETFIIELQYQYQLDHTYYICMHGDTPKESNYKEIDFLLKPTHISLAT